MSLDYSDSGLLAGVDEAGRGPLAGPVYAAAVILRDAEPIAGLRDSKEINEQARPQLAAIIQERALAYAISSASVAEIEEINILQASLLAMQRAITALQTPFAKLRVDGIHLPQLDSACESEAVKRGDSKIAAIAAASVLAKVARDSKMAELDKEYPVYGFSRNKGYGTKQHIAAIKRYGISPVHRRTFNPVKEIYAETQNKNRPE